MPGFIVSVVNAGMILFMPGFIVSVVKIVNA